MFNWILIFKRRILKRIIRRIRYVFCLEELSKWEYESCERCGHCFRVVWSVKDEKWNAVHGNDGGCLCVDCFVELAHKKNVRLEKNDFEIFEIFLPD